MTVAESRHVGPIVVSPLIVGQCELAEEGILTALADATFDQLFFAALYIVFFEQAVNFLLAGKRIVDIEVAGAQIFHDIARKLFICLVPAGQWFEDHPIRQVLKDLSVQLGRFPVCSRRSLHLRFHSCYSRSLNTSRALLNSTLSARSFTLSGI